MRLLIVDDDDAVRRLASRVLSQAGYETAVAASGEAALDLGPAGFDIVLSDLEMPGIDGNELTRRIRQAGSSDVIILTAHPEIQSVIQALRDGAYDYLCKPFTAEGLVKSVQRCAQKRALSKELAAEKALRAELERSSRLRALFGQFATPEVAARALEQPDEFWKRGERVVAAVMFADVRRFTPFAGRVPPEEAVQALNQIFERVIRAVAGSGGILNKFMGDGMMAVFGAPVPLANPAEAAAEAALRAAAQVDALARERESRGEPALRIGIGLNLGSMVAGCLGTRDRTEYSVIGHEVNLAARLEEQAEPGQVLVGPECAARLKGFELRRGRLMRLAGVEEPVQTFILEARQGAVR